MKRDSIFYQLFRHYPRLLFELLADPPANADAYRFDSVAVKEPRFEIDGVFLPPSDSDPGVIYFCEVQFQKDERLYERVFAESTLYFYRNRDRASDWQAVIIYPSRRLEQSDLYPHRGLLNSTQVHRVYLDELGDIRQLPLWIALMVLTTIEQEQAPTEARYLLSRTQQEALPPASQAILEMVTTIMVYRFEQLSRLEVETMLGITLQETRVYREIKEEGRQEGRQEGRRQEAESLILKFLTKRIDGSEEEIQAAIAELPLAVLEDLTDALFDFNTLTDLQDWIETHRIP